MRWRTWLLATTALFAALYATIVLVALVVSGPDLLRQPLTYYAALMPLAYCGVCWLTALGQIPTAHLRWIGITVHCAVAPCVVVSFLGLGVVLPVLAWLWYRVYRWRLSTGRDAG